MMISFLLAALGEVYQHHDAQYLRSYIKTPVVRDTAMTVLHIASPETMVKSGTAVTAALGRVLKALSCTYVMMERAPA